MKLYHGKKMKWIVVGIVLFLAVGTGAFWMGRESVSKYIDTPNYQLPTTNDKTSTIFIDLDKNMYAASEQITYTIQNNENKTIYYRYGCTGTTGTQIFDFGKWNNAITNISEFVPKEQTIQPRNATRCTWNGKIWLNPNERNEKKYVSFPMNQHIPGKYKIKLRYCNQSDDDGKLNNNDCTIIYSNQFIIK